MNKLTAADRVWAVSALVEGNSIRATSRMTGAAKGTILKLLADMGQVCAVFHDEAVRGVRARYVQADEIWCFVAKKEKQLSNGQKLFRHQVKGVGSVWTWKAIDADSKLLISHHVGARDADAAYAFMRDLASRLVCPVQLTTDGHGVYPDAVWANFGPAIDYGQLVKRYGTPQDWLTRYSPPEVVEVRRERVLGNPAPGHISTSYIERLNLNLRMSQRRFTRLTNAFSKKFENLCHAVALYSVHYNFCRKDSALKGKSPAMAAGLADYVWTIEELVSLLESKELQEIAGGSLKRGKYAPRKRCA